MSWQTNGLILKSPTQKNPGQCSIIYKYARTHVLMCIYVHTCVCVYVSVRVCMCESVCECEYTHLST